jgi:hypothetical protein
MALVSIIWDNVQYLGKNPLNGDQCLMLQNEDNKTAHDNKSTARATEASRHQDKPVRVSIVHNQQKAIIYSTPKIVHPVYEPWAKELNTNVVESS